MAKPVAERIDLFIASPAFLRAWHRQMMKTGSARYLLWLACQRVTAMWSCGNSKN